IGPGAWRARQRHSMFEVRRWAFDVRPSFCPKEAPPLRGGFHAIFGTKPRSGFVERAARSPTALSMNTHGL
ncbi:MAG: hypothetical protein JXQ71_00195, partial [Verrucomicrobia bacterium]|nr:hypothetical protein [Verrucomicrobiota bacterium]